MRSSLVSTLLCAGALLAGALPVLAQRGPSAQTLPTAASDASPIPPDSNSATEHTLALDGKALRYTATAGTLLINDEEEKPYGSIFYVAYTLGDVTDVRTRPVTFLYNGGPGSASVWLHMGSVGPVRVVTGEPRGYRLRSLPVGPEPVQPAGQDRLGVCGCAGYRLLSPRRQGHHPQLRRNGPGRASLPQIH
ncbi:exported hypothetical protein [Candidatus Sulfopaludibacter sp. SbA3]|nr:exported hypothetical protein [Candidatus Sulfopaludibacter sp. SbA3]